jgi:N-succinyldiaminopimelate aminotransferase
VTEQAGSRDPLVERMRGFGTTIFARMSALAEATGSINLGQGFPDTDGPPELLDAAVAAIRGGANQYPPGPGIAPLRQAIAAHQQRFYGLAYDPDAEVLVTAGATEAIAAAILGLVEPGQEVVTFEPLYDSYGASIALAGARRRVVPLRRDGLRWTFDPDELRAAVTGRTAAILFNSPHNPTGKVFDPAELAQIAQLAIDRDLIVIADEVYEHLIFEGAHVPIASLPGMRDRTVTISSAGKTFSATGWKIGWACAPASLLTAVRTVKQFLTYVSGSPFQPAVAAALALPDGVYLDASARLRAQRDLLCDGLAELGYDVIRPQATYFATVELSSDALEFCERLPERAGVVAIPSSVFYDSGLGDRYVRFAFCKRPEVLREALSRLGGAALR